MAKVIAASPDPLRSKNAIDVLALLEWAFIREQVHKARDPIFGKEIMFRPVGLGGRDSTERIGAAVGKSMNLGFVAPADAYAVLDAVKRCGAEALVRQHALAMSVPDWIPCPRIWSEPLKCMTVADAELKDRKGRPLVIEFYPFVWRGDLPEIVAERRRNYRRWASAIHKLHALLRVMNLDRYVLTANLPDIEPWQSR